MTPATLPAAAAKTHAPASPWPVFWVASVAAFLVSLDSTMLYAAFGALRSGFPTATAADMSWVLNAYTVVYAAMLIPAGGATEAVEPMRMIELPLDMRGTADWTANSTPFRLVPIIESNCSSVIFARGA